MNQQADLRADKDRNAPFPVPFLAPLGADHLTRPKYKQNKADAVLLVSLLDFHGFGWKVKGSKSGLNYPMLDSVKPTCRILLTLLLLYLLDTFDDLFPVFYSQHPQVKHLGHGKGKKVI